MKKMRNKGKVYPSSSSTTTTTTTTTPPPPPPPTGDNILSILNLLPATILTLTIVLSLEDKNVLAYMITLNTKKKTLKTHTTPLFECDCFDCYTSYWFKWDSSPNHELINQAIEAFEESLTTSNETTKKKTKKKGHRSLAGKTVFPAPDQKGIQDSPKGQMGHPHLAGKSCTPAPEVKTLTENGQMGAGKTLIPSPEQKGIQDSANGEMGHCQNLAPVVNGVEDLALPEKEETRVFTEVVERAPAMSQHNKGLARKVLPDVIGLFNWRLWSLWSPNV